MKILFASSGAKCDREKIGEKKSSTRNFFSKLVNLIPHEVRNGVFIRDRVTFHLKILLFFFCFRI